MQPNVKSLLGKEMSIKLKLGAKETQLHKNLDGKSIYLSCFNEEDSSFLLGCYENYDFMRLYRSWSGQESLCEEDIKKKISEDKKLSALQTRKIEWVIWRKSSDIGTMIPVGIAGLVDYRVMNKQAEFSIGLLEGYRNSGTAFEAIILIFDFSFNALGLNKLVSIIYKYNEAAQKSAVKLGFVQEGILRKHHWDERNSEFISIYYNGFLQEEFRSNKKISRVSKSLIGRDITEIEKPLKIVDKDKIEQVKKIFENAYKAG